MMSSLYHGVEGIKVQGFGMDVTANNISNVNTVGYKYVDAQFKDIFAQRVTSQSYNPADKNLSSQYGATRITFSQGDLAATDGEFDVALAGKGFFGVLGADGSVYYTRNGSFRRDAAGNLVDSYGNFILGTQNPALTNINYSDRISQLMGATNNIYATSGYTVSNDNKFSLTDIGAQTPLQVPNNMYLPPKVTQNVKFSGSLNSSTKSEIVTLDLEKNNANLTINKDTNTITLSGKVTPAEIFSAKAGDRILFSVTDANGNKLNFESVLDENLEFSSKELSVAGLDIDSLELSNLQIATEQEKGSLDILESKLYNADGSINFVRVSLQRILPDPGEISYKAVAQIYNADGEALGAPSEGMLVFDEKGGLKSTTLTAINNPGAGAVNLDFGTPAQDGIIGSGFNGLYVNANKAKEITTTQDGVEEGFFSKYDIAEDGTIVASFSNGLNKMVGKLALYNFINEEGLASMGDNLYAATGKSGAASFIMKNGEVVNTAKFRGGFLEQSNTSLATELSNLIVVQRAYDASSKSITTSDQILQRVINMKR